MKSKLLALFLASALSVSSSFAWVGGPWSGNVADNSAGEGTYQGTIKGKNLVGVFIFQYSASVATAAEATANNAYVVFHKGVSGNGSTRGVVDTEGRTVSGVFESTANIQVGDVTTDIPTGGGFIAKMTTTAPQIRFEGKGSVSTEATGVSGTASSTSFSEEDTSTDTIEASLENQTIDVEVSGVRTSVETA